MTTITLIGAGSVIFTKNLLGDILSYPELIDCTIRLHDIDPLRLETAQAMAAWTARTLGVSPCIEASLDRRQALDGADYVINMVQIGGHQATLLDFDIPRRYGLRQTIGDTHSVGGIFRALRTIPFMLALAADMQAVCPKALLINYTNPMSMLSWAIFDGTPIQAVGLCHSVQQTTQQMAAYAGLPYSEVNYLGAGINHMSWILRFEYQGRDAYPYLRQALENGRIPATDQVRAEIFRRFGCYITESSEHVAEYSAHFIPHAGEVERLQIPLDEYPRRSAENLAEFESIRRKLEARPDFSIERSAEYASIIIHAMETGAPSVIYGNVRNTGLIENLPSGCCVEVPCLVDRNGIQPTHIGKLPPHLAGFIQPHITVHELVVHAVLAGNRDSLYQAVLLDPLASASMTIANIWQMVDELIDAHQTYLPAALRSPRLAATPPTYS